MGGVRAISSKIVKHRIDRRGHRRDFSKAGKDRAIADWGVDHEGWSLCHLQSVKFRGALANAGLDLRRFGALG